MNTTTQDRPLQTTTITVQYVNEPMEGKKKGSIRDADGVYYGAYPDKLKLFEPGEDYEIAFKEDNGFRAVMAAKRVQRQQQQRTAPVSQDAPKTNGNYRQVTHPTDAKSMFVCSQINAMITSHQIEMTVEAVARAIRMLGEAYDLGNSTENQFR